MIRMVPLLLVLAALLACRSSAETKRVRAPDGRIGYFLNCKTPAHCHEKAGKICPRGYDRFERGQTVEQNPLAGFDDTTRGDYIVRDTMLIACR